MGAHGDLRPKFFQTPDHKFLTHRVLKKKSTYVLHIIVIIVFVVFVAFVVFVIIVAVVCMGGQPGLCSPMYKDGARATTWRANPKVVPIFILIAFVVIIIVIIVVIVVVVASSS
jgi:hypothetical protein